MAQCSTTCSAVQEYMSTSTSNDFSLFSFCIINNKNSIMSINMYASICHTAVRSRFVLVSCGHFLVYFETLLMLFSFHITPSSSCDTCESDPVSPLVPPAPRYPVCSSSLRLPCLVPECLRPHVQRLPGARGVCY